MPRLLLQWMLALVALWGMGCQATVLSAAQPQFKLQGADIAILRDATGTLTVEELARDDKAAAFTTLNEPPQLGFSQEVVWLRLRLQRAPQAPQTWFLEYSNPYINDLRLYTPTPSGFTVEQAGDQFAFAERALKFRYPVFALTFADTGVQTFYLRLASDSNLSGGLLVWQPKALHEHAQQEHFYFGLTLGIILMSLLLSALHWYITGERKALLYAILTVSVFCMVASGLGLVAQLLTPTRPAVADLLVPWSLAINTVTVGLVLGHALNIRADFPRMVPFFHLAYGLALLAPFTRVFNLYSVWGGPLLQAVSLLVLLATCWVSWRRWRAKVQGGFYFLAAHIVLIASLLAGRMILMGWLPANPTSQLSWLPGLLSFLFLLHVGMVVETQAVRRQRDAALRATQTADAVLASERGLREEQTVFFSFVAHELRSPLSAMVMGLKNLETDWLQGKPTVLDRTERIKSYAEKMGSLINRHLSLQRLAQADFRPLLVPTDPRPVAEESLRHVRDLFVDHLFVYDASVAPPVMAHLDADLLRMGLENLLINAAKFSPLGSAITLEVRADTALRCSVSDHGPGIPADQREQLFSVFHRMQQGPVEGGFGIGLAIAWRVAQVHGGSLDYADRPGGGAVFTLNLPLVPSSAPQENAL